MAFDDLNNTHNPATGTVAPAAWGDQVRDNFEFLIDPPSCSVSGSSAQSVSNATWTALNAGTENYDNDAMHSTVSNTSRITVQTTGRYQVTATVSHAASSGGSLRAVRFLVDGTTVYDGQDLSPTGAVFPCKMTATRTLGQLTASQYVECQVFHDVGSSNNVTLGEFVALHLTR